MIRIVLAGESEASWRIFRQPQWMAHVRLSPKASQWPRHHFDIEEPAYQEARQAVAGAEVKHLDAISFEVHQSSGF